MDSNPFSFILHGNQDRARAGVFSTPHGPLETPVFAPVGTQATVKAMTPLQLQDAGATLVLSNTYHLYLRPGSEIVAEMGGLHQFMQWPNPILTDSGGFQVFSLSKTRKVDEDGVTFKSHIDGSSHRFTPEISIGIQEQLGADIIMSFDECAEPYNQTYILQAMERTHRWAERSLKAKTRNDQALFGIVQGGIDQELRRRSAEFIRSLDFPGHAIGGLSVGETKKEMHATLEWMDDLLPKDKPRYLMGVGSPEDIVEGIARGVDIFDCVLPTRLARHQAAFSPSGRINLLNAVFAHDSNPISSACSCYTCSHFSRAYLRHLVVAKEMLAATLISIHNIATLIDLTKKARQAIINNEYDHFRNDFHSSWGKRKTDANPLVSQERS